MTQLILDDKDILQNTVQLNDNGYVQFKYTLPGKDGRTVKSDSIPRSALSGEAIITWCNFVRTQIAVDQDNTAAEKEKLRQARMKAEDEAKAAQEVQVEQPTPNSGLILPTLTAASTGQSLSLWQQYGQLLGELERVKAQLRASGEQV